MNSSISQMPLIRGADGRLYAVSGRGVTEVAENGSSAARSSVRAGDRVDFNAQDHEAGRYMITPGM